LFPDYEVVNAVKKVRERVVVDDASVDVDEGVGFAVLDVEVEGGSEQYFEDSSESVSPVFAVPFEQVDEVGDDDFFLVVPLGLVHFLGDVGFEDVDSGDWVVGWVDVDDVVQPVVGKFLVVHRRTQPNGPGFILTGIQRTRMATDAVSDRVRELAEHHDIDESAIIQRAVETGVETLYRDMIISRYLADEITREGAIEQLGVEVVEEVESARDAVEEDVKWGPQV
jgi:predicted transcriptional regulator